MELLKRFFSNAFTILIVCITAVILVTGFAMLFYGYDDTVTNMLELLKHIDWKKTVASYIAVTLFFTAWSYFE